MCVHLFVKKRCVHVCVCVCVWAKKPSILWCQQYWITLTHVQQILSPRGGEKTLLWVKMIDSQLVWIISACEPIYINIHLYSTPSKNRDVIAYFTTIVVGPYSSISGACYTWWSHLIFSSHLRRWWSQDLACHTVDTSWRGNSSLFSTHPKKKVPEMAILT